jgi:glycolate oxidase
MPTFSSCYNRHVMLSASTHDELAKRIQAFHAEAESSLPKGTLTSDPADLVVFGFDASKRYGVPDIVATPGTQDEAVQLVAIASKHQIPIVTRGAGSGLTGGAVPSKGGMVLNLARLNHIVEIDTANLTATVEAGVICGELDRAAAKAGLFYPPSPGSADYSTIGGNIMENAGGMRAYKYGVTRDYVLQLKCVLPSGEVFTAGSHAVKNVTGYDLARILVGSEGTLAVLLQATLRLIPQPNAIGTMLALFTNDASALTAAQEIVAAPLVPRAMEYMDDEVLRCIRAYRDLPQLKPEAHAALLLEADGASDADVQAQLEAMAAISKRHSPLSIEQAASAADREALWDVRNSVSPALFQLGGFKLSEDISVPRACCLEFVKRMREIAASLPQPITAYGHVGDGTMHITLMLNGPNDPQLPQAEKVVEELFKLAVSLKGSLSAEHGIGLTKRTYMSIELSPVELRLMRGIKAVFDPHGILNPGKVFPEE